jgi:hypothetical protein
VPCTNPYASRYGVAERLARESILLSTIFVLVVVRVGELTRALAGA